MRGSIDGVAGERLKLRRVSEHPRPPAPIEEGATMWIIPRAWTTDPDVAFILCAAAGALIFVDGGLALAYDSSFLPFLSLALGVVIFGSALAFRSRISYRKPLGGLVMALSLVSFFAYSGFFLGALLGLAGGVFAIAARGGSYLNPRTSLFGSQSLGPPCPRCGKSVPSWTSKCPYCGYPE
jgi:hypothetical protein